MLIARRWVVTPGENTLYAAVAVALSVLVFAYSVRLGPVSILAFYGVWAVAIAVEPRIVLVNIGRTVLLFALAGLAILSTLWSEAPSSTLRAGIQYATTIACAIVAARVVSPRDLILGGVFGVALVLLYSVAFPSWNYDFLDATYAFVGAFQSKNQLGFFSSLGILFGTAVAADGGRNILLRLFAVGVVLASAVALMMSQSATSIITVVAAVGAVALFSVISRIPSTERLVVLLAGTFVVVMGALGALNAGAFDAVLEVFGKDTSLTGRTYLWREGLFAASQNPTFGQGYSSFWVIGNATAEQLWEEFYITGRTGFHFHNTYIELMVGLGYAGIVLLLGHLLWTVTASVSALFGHRGSLAVVVLIAGAALLIMRSYVEIDFLTPYTVGTFLLYYTLSALTALRGAPRPVPSRAGTLRGAVEPA